MGNKIYDNYKRQVDESIKMYRDKFNRHGYMIPDELPEPYMVSISNGISPYLFYPYDKKLITDIREIMEHRGWTWGAVRPESQVGKFDDVVYSADLKSDGHEYDYISIIFAFSDTRDGANCKRVEIGEVDVPSTKKKVYEFVCE